jgi:hypothetical protein
MRTLWNADPASPQSVDDAIALAKRQAQGEQLPSVSASHNPASLDHVLAPLARMTSTGSAAPSEGGSRVGSGLDLSDIGGSGAGGDGGDAGVGAKRHRSQMAGGLAGGSEEDDAMLPTAAAHRGRHAGTDGTRAPPNSPADEAGTAAAGGGEGAARDMRGVHEASSLLTGLLGLAAGHGGDAPGGATWRAPPRALRYTSNGSTGSVGGGGGGGGGGLLPLSTFFHRPFVPAPAAYSTFGFTIGDAAPEASLPQPFSAAREGRALSAQSRTSSHAQLDVLAPSAGAQPPSPAPPLGRWDGGGALDGVLRLMARFQPPPSTANPAAAAAVGQTLMVGGGGGCRCCSAWLPACVRRRRRGS